MREGEVRTLGGILALILILASTGAPVLAEDDPEDDEGQVAYVTDALEVTLREGPGTAHSIARMIASGTEVRLLDRDGRWSRVETAEGQEGWVLGRYLESEPVGRFRIEQLERRLTLSAAESHSLFLEIMRLRDEVDGAEQRIAGLREENDLLSDRLDQASEGLRMEEDNERLRERIARQQEEIRELRNHAMELADRDRKEWFVVGAGVLLTGVVVGLFTGSMRGRRKRDRWGGNL